ncbi:MAG: hypothetical protein WCX22_10345 [Methanoregula sp.]|jgi:hypothetical protein
MEGGIPDTPPLAFGGTAVRDSANKRFAAILRCHDANGEISFVNFSREQVTHTSFLDETIRRSGHR